MLGKRFARVVCLTLCVAVVGCGLVDDPRASDRASRVQSSGEAANGLPTTTAKPLTRRTVDLEQAESSTTTTTLPIAVPDGVSTEGAPGVEPGAGGPDDAGGVLAAPGRPRMNEEEKKRAVELLELGVTQCNAFNRLTDHATRMYDLPAGQPREFYAAYVQELIDMADQLSVLSPPANRPQVALMAEGFRFLAAEVAAAPDFPAIRRAAVNHLRRYGSDTEKAIALYPQCTLPPEESRVGIRPANWWDVVASRIPD